MAQWDFANTILGTLQAQDQLNAQKEQHAQQQAQFQQQLGMEQQRIDLQRANNLLSGELKAVKQYLPYSSLSDEEKKVIPKIAGNQLSRYGSSFDPKQEYYNADILTKYYKDKESSAKVTKEEALTGQSKATTEKTKLQIEQMPAELKVKQSNAESNKMKANKAGSKGEGESGKLGVSQTEINNLSVKSDYDTRMKLIKGIKSSSEKAKAVTKLQSDLLEVRNVAKDRINPQLISKVQEDYYKNGLSKEQILNQINKTSLPENDKILLRSYVKTFNKD